MMRPFVKSAALCLTLMSGLLLQGCSPEVGSPDWCDDMKSKETGDWTANEVSAFTRSCLLPRAE